MYFNKTRLFWYFVLVVVLISLVWGLVVATKRINYSWSWHQLPQQFIFSGGEPRYADKYGEAAFGETKDGKTKITINYDDGDKAEFILETESLLIGDGDLINEGDELGNVHVVKMGVLVHGLLVTLQISFLSSILGLALGLVFGLFKLSDNPLLHWLASIYIEIIRGTPLLVQIFIFYYFLGTVLSLDRITAGVWALGVFAGAYVAEIIRAGIQSIEVGQMEAARSLGMNYFYAMIDIILPQAFKRSLPALAGQFISLIKDSSLVSVIAITDLTKAGREVISSNFSTFEIWFTVAGLYFVLTFGLSLIVKRVERKFAVSD